jgi:hypothetical protein
LKTSAGGKPKAHWEEASLSSRSEKTEEFNFNKSSGAKSSRIQESKEFINISGGSEQIVKVKQSNYTVEMKYERIVPFPKDNKESQLTQKKTLGK